jgi:hypothetical protein
VCSFFLRQTWQIAVLLAKRGIARIDCLLDLIFVEVEGVMNSVVAGAESKGSALSFRI